jgi:hypothetical protein
MLDPGATTRSAPPSASIVVRFKTPDTTKWRRVPTSPSAPWPKRRPVVAKQNPLEGEKIVRSQDLKTNTQNAPRIIFPSEVAEEKGQNGPTSAEIRERAFEIHLKRGGVHGCELDDWLQAERELQEKYNKNNDGETKKK